MPTHEPKGATLKDLASFEEGEGNIEECQDFFEECQDSSKDANI
jgi:hypothetical protein